MITRQSINKNGKFVIFFIALFWMVFVARAVQIQIIESHKYNEYAEKQHRSDMVLAARRGSIIDCRGRTLACDIEAKSYTVNPRYMKNKDMAAAKLANIVGNTKAYWLGQFARRPGYLMVARRVSQEMAYRLDNSGIETLKVRPETRRIYPYGELASEVIGRTDADNKGISGLEAYYDDALAGVDGQSIYLQDAYGKPVPAWEHTLTEPHDGADVYLALDINMQEIVEDELRTRLDSCGAKWGTAVFMDTETGGILACATIERNPGFRRARAIVDMNEPGSTAKLVPLATVFEEKLFEPDQIIDVEGGKYSLGKHLIRDDHAHNLISISEVGVYSSNIGAAKLGLAAGAERIYKTLVQLGFGTKTGIDFPGETPGMLYKPSTWTKHELAIICFGYGVTASALQIARAYGVVASGGELLRPYFATKRVTADSVEQILNSKVVVRKVLSERTIRILDDIFRNVVQDGTAKRAIDDICVIAGKTGTAMRLKEGGGGYETGKALASFAGYFPADNPKVVGIVMYDEPKTSIYGGEVSAPVYKNIAKRYGLMPNSGMFVNYKARSKEVKVRQADAGKSDEARIMKLSGKKRPVAKKADEANGAVGGGFCDFTGLTVRDALRKAKSMRMNCRVTGSGRIASQVPPAGADTTGVVLVELVGDAP
jgi:cell division protein FtsI (penicillin-binding protein 3)